MTAQTFTARYRDGEEVQVKRIPAAKIKDLITLQKALLEHFLWSRGYQGDLFTPENTAVWGAIRQMCEILPLAGKDGAFLEFDRLDWEDWDELCRVFFTGTTNIDESGALVPVDGEGYLPSEIAKLNRINFYQRLIDARQAVIDRQIQEQRELLKAQQAEREEQEGTPKIRNLSAA